MTNNPAKRWTANEIDPARQRMRLDVIAVFFSDAGLGPSG